MITKHELVVHLLWEGVIMCLNLGVCEIRILFSKIIFWDGWEGSETLAVGGRNQKGWKKPSS